MMSCLEETKRAISSCSFCKRGVGKSVVVGEGGEHPKIVFVGEAPGKKEVKLQRPFVGRSGQLLRQLILSSSLKDEDYYITSAVKYLPLYVTPKEVDIVHGRLHLFAQLQCLRPRLVVLLGRSAVWSVLDQQVAIATVHGSVVEHHTWSCLLTVHPAAAVRNNRYGKMLREDFDKIKKLLIE